MRNSRSPIEAEIPMERAPVSTEGQRQVIRGIFPVGRSFPVSPVRRVLDEGKRGFPNAAFDHLGGDFRVFLKDGEGGNGESPVADKVPVMGGINPPVVRAVRHTGKQGLVIKGFPDELPCFLTQIVGAPVKRQGDRHGHFRHIEEMGGVPVFKPAECLQLALKPLQVNPVTLDSVDHGKGKRPEDSFA